MFQRQPTPAARAPITVFCTSSVTMKTPNHPRSLPTLSAEARVDDAANPTHRAHHSGRSLTPASSRGESPYRTAPGSSRSATHPFASLAVSDKVRAMVMMRALEIAIREFEANERGRGTSPSKPPLSIPSSPTLSRRGRRQCEPRDYIPDDDPQRSVRSVGDGFSAPHPFPAPAQVQSKDQPLAASPTPPRMFPVQLSELHTNSHSSHSSRHSSDHGHPPSAPPSLQALSTSYAMPSSSRPTLSPNGGGSTQAFAMESAREYGEEESAMEPARACGEGGEERTADDEVQRRETGAAGSAGVDGPRDFVDLLRAQPSQPQKEKRTQPSLGRSELLHERELLLSERELLLREREQFLREREQFLRERELHFRERELDVAPQPKGYRRRKRSYRDLQSTLEEVRQDLELLCEKLDGSGKIN